MGSTVNLEVDVVAKYVERLVGFQAGTRRGSRSTWTASSTSSGRSPTSPRARPSSSSTTRTARTRATSIFAAEHATPELVSFMVRYTSGYICVPLTGEACDRLDLPPAHSINQDRHGTAYTVSVDAREGIGTGISGTDRAHTIRVLAEPGVGADRPRAPRARRAAAGPRRRRAAPARAHRGRGRPGAPGRAGARRRDLRDRVAEGRRRHGAVRGAARSSPTSTSSR